MGSFLLLYGSVIPPFSQRQPFDPLCLFIRYKAMKISFQTFVHYLNFPIRLRMYKMSYELTEYPNIPPLVLQRNIWIFLHIIVSPPIIVAPCQHVQHDPSKTCCRLVYHQKNTNKNFLRVWKWNSSNLEM